MTIRTRIESLGVYLPDRKLSSQEVMEGCATKLNFDLAGITGIKNRPVAGENEFALDLAVKAVSKCFQFSRYRPQEMDMIISASISRIHRPNWEWSHEPASAAKLAGRLQMRSAIAFDISNACAGMFTAILVMDAYLKAGWIKRGLIVSGEYITHLTRTAQFEIKSPFDPQFASLTLGDSGAALILDATDDPALGFQDLEMFTAAQHCELCVGTPHPNAQGGYVMHTDSSKMFKIGMALAAEQIVAKVKDSRWSNSDRLHVIYHQVASRAIQAGGKIMKELSGSEVFSPSHLVDNMEHRGNTSTTSHFVALWDRILDASIRSGDSLLFGIQASGLTLGVATYTLDDLPQRILAGERGQQLPLAA